VNKKKGEEEREEGNVGTDACNGTLNSFPRCLREMLKRGGKKRGEQMLERCPLTSESTFGNLFGLRGKGRESGGGWVRRQRAARRPRLPAYGAGREEEEKKGAVDLGAFEDRRARLRPDQRGEKKRNSPIADSSGLRACTEGSDHHRAGAAANGGRGKARHLLEKSNLFVRVPSREGKKKRREASSRTKTSVTAPLLHRMPPGKKKKRGKAESRILRQLFQPPIL